MPAMTSRRSNAESISPVLKFTGVQIERFRETRIIRIHQERYIEQMAETLKGEITKQDTPHGNSKEQRQAFDKILENKESPPIDRILTRTSTHDDLANNESSFVTEMKEVAQITRGLAGKRQGG